VVAFFSVRSHSTTGVRRFTRLQAGTRVPASDAFHRQLWASISSPWHGLRSGAHFACSLSRRHQAPPCSRSVTVLADTRPAAHGFASHEPQPAVEAKPLAVRLHRLPTRTSPQVVLSPADCHTPIMSLS
jgi:hypothetical protein